MMFLLKCPMDGLSFFFTLITNLLCLRFVILFCEQVKKQATVKRRKLKSVWFWSVGEEQV